MCSKPALSQQVRTTYQTTFCEMPRPHTFPNLATARKILPSLTPAARVHWSSAALTQFGMDTVRMWPPLPIRSTTAQWLWRTSMSSNSKPTSSDLRKPQPKQHGQHRVIALRAHTVTTSALEYFRTLLCAQPIAGTESELLDSFNTANPGSQLGTQQTGIGGFVSQATHGCKLLVDGIGGQTPRFQVHPIAHNHDAVKGQPRLRAVPS